MHLRLDPWAVEYNTSYHAEVVAEDSGAEVDVGVERPAGAWEPLAPAPTEPLWDELLFLDGSRRVEARLLLEDGLRQTAFGVMGSYGVGAVWCCARGSRPARFVDESDFMVIQRVCALSAGQRIDNFNILELPPLRLGRLEYRVEPTGEQDSDAVVRRLQAAMREAEAQLAARLIREFPGALVVCDGPRPYLGTDRNLIGYVKTIHNPRVGQRELDVVRKLRQGERSPIYLVESRNPEHRTFEWFFRLRDPNPWLYSLAGMVRLQAHAGTNPAERLEGVQQLADWLCGRLPVYASRQHQDPRAPQQLLPVRALEAELGRRMGHPQLIRRRITRYLSAQLPDA
ncbi:MAG TPA: hypothetical protein VF171_06250 [Trueperaceae bacterium]